MGADAKNARSKRKQVLVAVVEDNKARLLATGSGKTIGELQLRGISFVSFPLGSTPEGRPKELGRTALLNGGR